ncbi:MAG: hypothetical protein H6817_11660 [Phycisphaerales bacterium]|nr:hypothetical protein [Phycisphaerales bacterium]
MKRIKPIKPLELRLVLEVAPYHWSKRPLPDVGPARFNPEIWDEYFRKCMADAEIFGIEPIEPGSNFADAFAVVRNELIIRMIRESLQGSGLPGFPAENGHVRVSGIESICGLDGGFAILTRDGDIFEPQCCTDFSTLDSWKSALEERPKSGQLWIGHPQATISFDAETVTVTEGWEGSQEPESLLWFSATSDELRDAVCNAEEARLRFAEALQARVLELITDDELAWQTTYRLMGDD